MPPKLLVYLIAKDLTGKSTTEEAFRERLTRFSRSAVIRLCCVLNMLLSKPSALYDAESHAKLVRSFFPKPIAEKIINSVQPAFHRHQLLYVAQEALRHCGEAGKDVMTPFWSGFGVVLLMASELLYSAAAKAESESDNLARRICQLLPDMEANGWQSYHLKVLRSFVMTSRFVEPLRNKPNFFDLAAHFEQASGIPLETYQADAVYELLRILAARGPRVVPGAAGFLRIQLGHHFVARFRGRYETQATVDFYQTAFRCFTFFRCH